MTDKTIAIVEDEEFLRENLQELLEFKGYTVIDFSTGEELLEQYDTLHVDAVLLDYQLPGMNGLDLMPILKERKPHVPIALVTASSQKETLQKAVENGADRIILKPYSHEDLFAAVEELLSLHPYRSG